MSGWSSWHSEPRFRLLLALVRNRPPAELEAELASALGDPTFRSDLLDLGARHRVYGLTVSRLAGLDRRAGLTPEFLDELAGQLGKLRRRAAIFDLKRERVLELLDRSEIQPIVLKGAGTSLTLYDDAAERDLDDLDLLVRKDEVDCALQSLAVAGYRTMESRAIVEAYKQSHFHVPMDDSDGHCVEVHWGLTLPKMPFRLASDELRERAITIDPPGTSPFRVPCHEHQLLHVVLQNIQESFSHLGRLVEIDRIAERTTGLDWEFLFGVARRGGVEAPLAVSLQLARRLLGTSVPEQFLCSVGMGRLSGFHIAIMRPEEYLLRQLAKRGLVAPRLLELWMVSGTGGKFHHLRYFLSEDSNGWQRRERRRIGVWERTRRLARILEGQMSGYLRGGLMLIRPGGREELSVWTRAWM